MTITATQNWAALGRAATRRRVELGYHTVVAFSTVVGLSTKTLGEVENAKRDSYDPATLARIEQALEWAPGSIHEVLAGGEPTDRPSAQHRGRTLSTRISGDRRAAGLTQQQLAEAVGVERKTVCRWENGRTQGLGTNLERLARVLGWSDAEVVAALRDDPGVTLGDGTTPAGRYLQQRMTALGYTTKVDLARAASVSPSTITRLFGNPDYRPDVGAMRGLATALKVDHNTLVSAIYGDAPTLVPTSLDPLAAELDRMLAPTSPLSDESRNALRNLAEYVIDRHRAEMRSPARAGRAA